MEYYQITFDKSAFIKKCKGFERAWDMGMGSLLGNVPSYQDALEAVMDIIDK